MSTLKQSGHLLTLLISSQVFLESHDELEGTNQFKQNEKRIIGRALEVIEKRLSDNGWRLHQADDKMFSEETELFEDIVKILGKMHPGHMEVFRDTAKDILLNPKLALDAEAH